MSSYRKKVIDVNRDKAYFGKTALMTRKENLINLNTQRGGVRF